jgi:hypothetical protein
MNAKELVKPVGVKETSLGNYASFDAEPSVIYPAAMAEILDLLAHPEKRTNTETERFYLAKAKRLSKEESSLFDLDVKELTPDELVLRAKALKALEDVWSLVDRDVKELKPDDLVLRAKALEIARLYFTATLHQQHGSPIHLHILKDPKYKLHVDVEV